MLILDLPVSGEWKLIRSPGHDRFAYDLVALDDEGRRVRASLWRRLLGRTTVHDSLSWEKPVVSPCDGRVVTAENNCPDREQLSFARDLSSLLLRRPPIRDSDVRPFAGNHLVVNCESAYVFLAHLRRGSVTVKPGQEVSRGKTVGLIGNSGFSLEPHLHFQVVDNPDLLEAKSLPFVIREFELAVDSTWQVKRQEPLRKGDRIRSVRVA